MVVVLDVIMHARFERINAIGPFEMEVLGFQGAEEAFNRCVVEAVAAERRFGFFLGCSSFPLSHARRRP